jgi:[citrate (pro-3S)-lyase] ligase
VDYKIERLWVKRSKKEKAMWEKLLQQAGIRSEELVDYTVGVFDGDKLIATGSRFMNVLKCIAVCKDYTGGEVISMLVSHLMSEVFDAGYSSIYVYTKAESVNSFLYLGFKEIERVEDKLVFLEKAVYGFDDFLENLKKKKIDGERISGIVMNANPFTKGHQYLVEKAASESDVLHVFVLSEDMSEFPAKTRIDLVRKGTAHLPNVHIHETGDYMVSSKTFPSYFLKEDADVTDIQASLDAKIFKEHIAPALGITTRYVGEEPLSFATNIYNNALKRIFSDTLELIIIPRKEVDGNVISASRVRQYMKEDRVMELKNLVPETTFEYLLSPEGIKIKEQIQKRSE